MTDSFSQYGTTIEITKALKKREVKRNVRIADILFDQAVTNLALYQQIYLENCASYEEIDKERIISTKHGEDYVRKLKKSLKSYKKEVKQEYQENAELKINLEETKKQIEKFQKSNKVLQ